MSEGSRLPSGQCGSLQDSRTWLSAPAVDEITLPEVIGASRRLAGGVRCTHHRGEKIVVRNNFYPLPSEKLISDIGTDVFRLS